MTIATLPALAVNYGNGVSWTMEIQQNYLEAADIVTSTSGGDATANAIGSDGITVSSAVWGTTLLAGGSSLTIPLNQARTRSRRLRARCVPAHEKCARD